MQRNFVGRRSLATRILLAEVLLLQGADDDEDDEARNAVDLRS